MAEPSPSKLARNKQPSYCGGLTNVWPLLAKQAKDVILTTSRNRLGTRRQELEPAHGTYSLTKHGLRRSHYCQGRDRGRQPSLTRLGPPCSWLEPPRIRAPAFRRLRDG